MERGIEILLTERARLPGGHLAKSAERHWGRRQTWEDHKLDEARSHGDGPLVPTLGKWRGGGSWKGLLEHGLGHGRLD